MESRNWLNRAVVAVVVWLVVWLVLWVIAQILVRIDTEGTVWFGQLLDSVDVWVGLLCGLLSLFFGDNTVSSRLR